MKFSILIFLLYCNVSFSQTSVYEISLKTLDSIPVQLSSFKGKKLLIAAVSPQTLQSGGLQYLDSLQLAYPTIKIFVIPAQDFGGNQNPEILTRVRNNFSKRVTVFSFSKVKKGARHEQHSLMKWLTSVSDNGHFDADVLTDQQLYAISESGVLYAVVGKGVSPQVLDEIIKQEDIHL